MLFHQISRWAHWKKITQIDKDFSTILLLKLITAARAEHRWKQIDFEASIFSTSFTRSNLDIFQLFLKHWIQLNQSYNYVFQSMSDSHCAYVDLNEERITTRWAIIQRSESLQSQLLSQIWIFFHYFWRFELIWFRARIMSFKVCQIVIAHMLIQMKKDDGRRKISQSAQWIFSTSFSRSNLNIFYLFWKHWIQLIQSYNYVFQSMWDSQRA